jgi:cobalt/nickel transport system permease protein
MSSRGRSRSSLTERLERALAVVRSDSVVVPGGRLAAVGAPPRLLVTLIYLVVMLSLSPRSLHLLLLFALYPPLASALCGVSYRRVVLRSLVVLPFVVFVGIFNPLFERDTALTLFGLPITYGWVTFLSLTVRGLLAAQSVVLLLLTVGFAGVCRSLRSFGVPALLVGQLMMLHRSLFTLLSEAVNMSRAVAARGFGRSSYPLRLWVTFISQLLLRSFDRAERVGRAMRARGFNL